MEKWNNGIMGFKKSKIFRMVLPNIP